VRIDLHPALPIAAAAALVPVLGARAGRILSVASPLGAALLVRGLPDGALWETTVLGLRLVPVRVDALARVFALAFSLFAALAGLYAAAERGRAVRAGGLGLSAAGVGLVLAGDLLTLALFWELLAVFSAMIVAVSDRPGARGAAARYLLLHAAGGTCLMAGIALRIQEGGLAPDRIPLDGPAGFLLLTAFAMNAAVPPLHAWLPDAYPSAGPAGCVYLSAFTTKGAVAVLARAFPGEEILIWAGTAMALYGVVFAVLENDIRRLLAYHIVSQVGYMVCGVGMGTALALDGAAAHAFCHIFYKGLLLMAAGAVLASTGRSKLTELGDLAGPLRHVLVLMLVGAASISGVPLFSGFVSKAMVVSAAHEAARPAVEILLTVASMGTFLHTGLKLPCFTFFGTARAPVPVQPVPRSMTASMVLAAAACVWIGVQPGLLYSLLPHQATTPGGGTYPPFTVHHVLQTLQLLGATALAFWLLRNKLGGEPLRTADVDRLYRRALPVGLAATAALLAAAARVREGLAALPRPLRLPGTSGPEPGLAGQVLWTALSAAAFLFGAWLIGSRGP
jgi:multicomponent Na+:H+ antiporter subunit D